MELKKQLHWQVQVTKRSRFQASGLVALVLDFELICGASRLRAIYLDFPATFCFLWKILSIEPCLEWWNSHTHMHLRYNTEWHAMVECGPVL